MTAQFTTIHDSVLHFTTECMGIKSHDKFITILDRFYNSRQPLLQLIYNSITIYDRTYDQYSCQPSGDRDPGGKNIKVKYFCQKDLQ